MEPTAEPLLRDRLAAVLNGREKMSLDLDQQVPAAVIIPIFERGAHST